MKLMYVEDDGRVHTISTESELGAGAAEYYAMLLIQERRELWELVEPIVDVSLIPFSRTVHISKSPDGPWVRFDLGFYPDMDGRGVAWDAKEVL